MGVGASHVPGGRSGPAPHQKFVHGPYFIGHLLSPNKVLQNIQNKPRPINKNYHYLISLRS